MLGGLSSLPLTCGNVSTYQEQFLAQIKASLGSLFTTENISLVGAENIATAHTLAAVAHCADAMTWQSVPSTATDSLLAWAERLGVAVRPIDTPHQIREACAAKYLAQSGPTLTAINDALAVLLKTALVEVHYFHGTTLASEPHLTGWAGGTTPYPANDLGSGQWFSVRAHVLVEVQQPSSLTFNEFEYLLNARLFDLLDQALPAYSTFDWTLGPNWAGFIIGESEIGYVAL